MVELEERIERSERGKDMGECMSIGEEGEGRTWVGERNSAEFSYWKGSLQDLKGSKVSGG